MARLPECIKLQELMISRRGEIPLRDSNPKKI